MKIMFFTIMAMSVMAAFVGCGFIAYSSTLAPFKDESSYLTKKQVIEDKARAILDRDVPYDERSEVLRVTGNEWYALRDTSLTPKYSLYDHGLTLVLLAITVGLSSCLYYAFTNYLKRGIVSPPIGYFYTFANLGIIALCAGSFASITIDYGRETSPYWSDSLGIPFFGIVFLAALLVPVFNIIALLLTINHSKGIEPNTGVPSLWLRIIRFIPLAIIFVLTVSSIAYGDYSSIGALVLWGFMFAGRAFFPKPASIVSPR